MKLLIVVMLTLVLAPAAALAETEELPLFSPSTLAEYDGFDGRPAYVAVDGWVYHFEQAFADGEHAGLAAGRDWSEALAESPHGFGVLEGYEPIGRFVALELTLEELSKYTGQNDYPAYVAVSGLIYDVTDSPRWRNGVHNGFQAGQDLTGQIENISPHGTRVLAGMPLIGVVVAAEE